MTVTPLPHLRPIDATLTVTRAARVLGVHPNTVRAWSDAGRLRYYRINPRGDRRYRLGDLQRFLAGAAGGPPASSDPAPARPARRRAEPRGDVPGGFASSVMAGADEPTPGAMPSGLAAALSVMTGLGRVAESVAGGTLAADVALGTAARAIREGAGFRHVSLWRLDPELLVPVGVSGPSGARARSVAAHSLLTDALAGRGEVVERERSGGVSGLVGAEIACAIPGPRSQWGVLVATADELAEIGPSGREIVAAAAETLGAIIRSTELAAALDRRVHRAEALSRVAGDIGSRLDLDQVLARLIDHAVVLFGADRAAVFLMQPDGTRRAVAARGLSAAYLTAFSTVPRGSLSNAAVVARRPVFAVAYRNDQRAGGSRAAVVQEGYDTVCIAPLLDGETGGAVGTLNVYHDQPHAWSSDELDAMAAFATQAGMALRSARTYAQLSTWAAQLQSIQQLGARLNRLTDVGAIGAAIATELRELIDYHNVRVYRVQGDDLIPVAMKGQVGEYIDETPEQLRVRIGSGITGWVAEHRIAQNLPDAAADPRANTIPGTDAGLDESMLLAPMLFEDQVLGVLVLSKLGLHQFQDDDLRLLVIYASFAAQAMAHADATERLRRQVRSQRELLQITESMLTTLDTSALLESVVTRLGDLVGGDNVAIELVDSETEILTPVVARGAGADQYMEPWLAGETGLATWVVERDEAVMLEDQYDDPRVLHAQAGPVHGGIICAPLRGRSGAIGVLTLERIGEGRRFSEDEFELVKLFAAQVSVAVQNARAHGAVARQAKTDDLTGMRNQRSFRAELATAVAGGDGFSLLIVDLDRFKLVNDTFGHEAGNDFLRRVAAAIVGASRETDAVFRYGGDEFAVLLPRTDAAHGRTVAERIRSAVSEVTSNSTALRTSGVTVDASAGLATFPADGESAETILLAADRACFVAKRSGGGRVADAGEGQALAATFTLQVPTPIDAGV
jgi:diguanylate cyclase (GGDEF)-like protein/excisionase family DNA binding protein